MIIKYERSEEGKCLMLCPHDQKPSSPFDARVYVGSFACQCECQYHVGHIACNAIKCNKGDCKK